MSVGFLQEKKKMEETNYRKFYIGSSIVLGLVMVGLIIKAVLDILPG